MSGPDDELAARRDEIAELRAEVERLRALVGPSETSYRELQADVAGAKEFARGAAADVGALRGQIAELHVQLARARQDQERVQQLRDLARRARRRAGRVARAVRRS